VLLSGVLVGQDKKEKSPDTSGQQQEPQDQVRTFIFDCHGNIVYLDPQAELPGKAGPEIAGDFAVNGKAVRLSDLKGKVVLLDFWGVWCPPCWRMLPSLNEMNQRYRDKGLKIVALTRYEGCWTFDKEKGTIKHAELSKAEEQGMLRDFAKAKKLGYLIQAMTKEEASRVHQAYKVRGCPSNVLIDKKGKIRLLKVGFDKNLEDIEKAVKELLAEE